MNLRGSYPASTSTHGGFPVENPSVPGATPAQLLAAEAEALLDAASTGTPVEQERLRAFARACIELSEWGRLALAVLDGGVFVPRRALELAADVLTNIGKNGSRLGRGRP